MVICEQYSASVVRRGIWEAFHHWLKIGDVLKSEFKTRGRKTTCSHTHMIALCACRFPEERVFSWQPARAQSEWPVPHLQWPALAHAVGTGGCYVFVCCHWSYLAVSPLCSPLVFTLKNVSLTGISQTGFHLWPDREAEDTEIRRSWRREKRGREEVKGVLHVELRQMSGIVEARSNADTQLGCNNQTCSSLQPSCSHCWRTVCEENNSMFSYDRINPLLSTKCSLAVVRLLIPIIVRIWTQSKKTTTLY